MDARRIGERVIVRTLQSTGAGGGDYRTWTFGSECDGAFAQYTKTFSGDALEVPSGCPMSSSPRPPAPSRRPSGIQRAGLGSEPVLVTGASGGVGSVAVQLARR